MIKFKVGDKVVDTQPGSYYGDLGHIIQSDEHEVRVVWDTMYGKSTGWTDRDYCSMTPEDYSTVMKVINRKPTIIIS